VASFKVGPNVEWPTSWIVEYTYHGPNGVTVQPFVDGNNGIFEYGSYHTTVSYHSLQGIDQLEYKNAFGVTTAAGLV
jgi:hypothetical protein